MTQRMLVYKNLRQHHIPNIFEGKKMGFYIHQGQYTIIIKIMSHHGKHWAGAHVLDKAREEWLVRQLLVVVAQKILGWLQMEMRIFT